MTPAEIIERLISKMANIAVRYLKTKNDVENPAFEGQSER